MKPLSLTHRFAVWFVAIALLPLLLSGWVLFRSYRMELQQTVLRQLENLADKKLDQIDAYLNGRLTEARIFSSSSAPHEAVRDFARTFAREGAGSTAYRELDARWRPFFADYVERSGYYDVFLISPQGTVVYSHTHESDFGTNLFTGPYRETGFANAVRDALGTLEGNLSEFDAYAPSQDVVAAFIALPLVNQGRVDGVLAIQLHTEPIFRVISDNVGLGESGETLLSRRLDDRTALMVAPLKFDPDAALKRQISLDNTRVERAIAKALRGERGSGVALDWRDRDVVAAWRYLPRLNYGLVVKIDADEALAPVARLRTLSLTIMGLATLAAVLGALLLGRRVVGPLRLLTRSAHNLATGDPHQRVPVQGRDELGQLAASFNTMAEQLAASRAQLEESLAITRKQFENLFEHGVDAIIMADERGRIVLVNRAAEIMFGYPRAELVGQSIEQLLPDEALRAGYLKNSAPPLMGPGLPDLRGRRKDGTEFPVEISVSPLPSPEGARVAASIRDVTQRQQAEEAVRKSEAKLQLAMAASQTALWDADIPADRIFLDERWAAMLGAPPASGVVTLRQLGRLVHPEDRTEVLRRQFEAIRGAKNDYDVEHRVRHRSGHWRWIRSRGQVVARDPAGKARRMIGTNTDITEAKLQAEQLRETLAIVQAQAAALTGTVAVLEQTKRSFRSTALAELRHNLEALLASIGKR